jgi:hypothetical protein
LKLVGALSAAPGAAVAASTAATAISPATTAAAVSAATTTVTTATSAAAATTWGASFTRPRFVYGQWPAFDGFAIQIRDRLLRVRFGRHGHERKTARFASEFILHQRDFLDCARRGEKVLEIWFGCVEGKIAYV